MTERSTQQSETAPSTPGSASTDDGPMPDSTVSLQHYLQPLRTHRRVVAAVALLTVTIGLAIAVLGPTSYSATTAVRVYPASTGPAAALSATSRTTDMETETRIATAHPVVEATAAELQERSIDVGVGTVRANLTVEAAEDSGVLDITYRSSNPTVARVGSEVATDEYLAYRAELNRLNRDAIRQSITDRISELREELVAVENQLSLTQADAGAAISLEVERESITGELTAQQRALAELSVLTADTAIVFDQAQEPSNPSGPGAPLILAGVLAGGLILGVIAAWALAALSPVGTPTSGPRQSLSAEPSAGQTGSRGRGRKSSRVRAISRDRADATKADQTKAEQAKADQIKAGQSRAGQSGVGADEPASDTDKSKSPEKSKKADRGKDRSKNRDKGQEDRELTSDELADWVDPLVAPLAPRTEVPSADDAASPDDSPSSVGGPADAAGEELFDPNALETIFGGAPSSSEVPPVLAGVDPFGADGDETAPGEAMFDLEAVSETVETPASLSPPIDELMADEVADLIFGEAGETGAFGEAGNTTGSDATDDVSETGPIEPPHLPSEDQLEPVEPTPPQVPTELPPVDAEWVNPPEPADRVLAEAEPAEAEPADPVLAELEPAGYDEAIEPDPLGTQTIEMVEPLSEAGPLSSGDPRDLEPGPASWNGPFIGPVTWDDIAAGSGGDSPAEPDLEPAQSSNDWPEAENDPTTVETSSNDWPEAATETDPTTSETSSTEGWPGPAPETASWPDPAEHGPTTGPDDTGWPEPPADASANPESVPGSEDDGSHPSDPLEPRRQPVPDLVATDGFSTLFQQLSHLGADGPVVAMSVGDCDSGAGLTVGFELADELRALGARVLLIDSLIDSPVLNRLFDERSMPGLAEVLAGHQSLQQVVRSLPDLPGLDLLTVGNTEPETETLLQDQPLANILSEARLDYHSIVIIAGPVLTPDGQWAPGIELIRGVARMVDGVIVGTRRPVGSAADADLVDVLSTVPAPLLQLITSSVGADEADPVDPIDPVDPVERSETPSGAVASGASAQMGL